MGNHTVNLADLIEFKKAEKIIFASSTKEQKQLYCTLKGGYEVWHKKEKVFETDRAFLAVRKYNSIQ